jgi:hypothetical protein
MWQENRNNPTLLTTKSEVWGFLIILKSYRFLNIYHKPVKITQKIFCNRTVYLIVSVALGVNVRDFLIKTVFTTGANVTNTLQLLLKKVFAKEVFRLPQPFIIHDVSFNDELF